MFIAGDKKDSFIALQKDKRFSPSYNRNSTA